MTSRILIIAGSDSGGGAGIQADIKTVTMLGGHAMTAITAITAQNTLGVQAVMPVPTDMVLAQIMSCLSDIGVDAVKIGMLGSAETAHAVADVLETLDLPIVFDPVMIATSGDVLADAATIAAFERLMRIASVVTPNLPELTALRSLFQRKGAGGAHDVGGDPSHPAHAVDAGSFALLLGEGALLVKGGHGEGGTIVDRLIDDTGEIATWSATRIETRHTHGTGCTLASAIATGLGAGLPLVDAIDRGIAYVRASLVAAPGLGAGHGPMGHALGLIPFDLLKDHDA